MHLKLQLINTQHLAHPFPSSPTSSSDLRSFCLLTYLFTTYFIVISNSPALSPLLVAPLSTTCFRPPKSSSASSIQVATESR